MSERRRHGDRFNEAEIKFFNSIMIFFLLIWKKLKKFFSYEIRMQAQEWKVCLLRSITITLILLFWMSYIKIGQPRETGNTKQTIRRKTQHNMCWSSLCATQANTNKINQTLLQTTGGKDEPNIGFMRNSKQTPQWKVCLLRSITITPYFIVLNVIFGRNTKNILSTPKVFGVDNLFSFLCCPIMCLYVLSSPW
jgi:hypothetical protein